MWRAPESEAQAITSRRKEAPSAGPRRATRLTAMGVPSGRVPPRTVEWGPVARGVGDRWREATSMARGSGEEAPMEAA